MKGFLTDNSFRNMEIEDIRSFCLSMPGVTEDIKWEHNLCFSVGGKLFLLISLDESPAAASFKVDEADFDQVSIRTGFGQAPYFARNKWVKVDDIGIPDRKEWMDFIRNSYELVKAGLPVKIRKTLDNL
jgi:predicted DNA-binding protein (MmcQ/YjbR family)